MIDYLPIISTRASFIRERVMGRNYCVVKNCNSTSVDFSMFRVPKTLSSEWVQVLQRPPDWTPTSSSKICERHFAPHHIAVKKTRKMLVSGAFPVPINQQSSYTDLGVLNSPPLPYQHRINLSWSKNIRGANRKYSGGDTEPQFLGVPRFFFFFKYGP